MTFSSSGPSSHLPLPQAAVQLLALQELLHLRLDQHPAHVDHLLHSEGQALHGVAELLRVRGDISLVCGTGHDLEHPCAMGRASQHGQSVSGMGRVSLAQAEPPGMGRTSLAQAEHLQHRQCHRHGQSLSAQHRIIVMACLEPGIPCRRERGGHRDPPATLCPPAGLLCAHGHAHMVSPAPGVPSPSVPSPAPPPALTSQRCLELVLGAALDPSSGLSSTAPRAGRGGAELSGRGWQLAGTEPGGGGTGRMWQGHAAWHSDPVDGGTGVARGWGPLAGT